MSRARLSPEELRARQRKEARSERNLDRGATRRDREYEIAQVLGQLRGLLLPNAEAIRDAMADLVNFKPEWCTFKERPILGSYSPGDEDAPFVSEAYLYNLLGKEDARSLLARISRLADALGLDLVDLYDDRETTEEPTP